MRWTVVALVVATLGMVGRVVFVRRNLPPRVVLEEVQRRRAETSFDERVALRDLEQALEEAVRLGDEDTAAEILLYGTDILLELGAQRQAIEYLDRALAQFRKGDLDIERRAIELRLDQGDLDVAEARAQAILGLDPHFAPAWTLRGRIHRERAEQAVEAALGVAERNLVPRLVEDARPLLRKLAILEKGDPTRLAYDSELRAVFGPQRGLEFEEAHKYADAAMQLNASARAAFARSLGAQVYAANVSYFLEFCRDAGHPEWVVEYGLAALQEPEVRRDWRCAKTMLQAMRELGQGEAVLELLGRWDWTYWTGPVEFYEEACYALYDAGHWTKLSAPARSLSELGGEREDALSYFFIGMAQFARKQNENAMGQLLKYFQVDPTPDLAAKVDACFAIAEINAERGALENERFFLETALAIAPEVDGDAWRRVVELQLQAENAGYTGPEERWARAMSLMPERTSEMMPLWTALGEKTLEGPNRDFDTIYRRLELSGTNRVPPPDTGPYVMYRVGLQHMENGSARAAARVAEELESQYPGLLPAVDLAIDANLALGRDEEVGRWLLRRLELVGRDERTVEILGHLKPETFDSAQVMEAMRSDPAHTGRLVFARQHIELGEFARALRTLAPLLDDLGIDPDAEPPAAAEAGAAQPPVEDAGGSPPPDDEAGGSPPPGGEPVAPPTLNRVDAQPALLAALAYLELGETERALALARALASHPEVAEDAKEIEVRARIARGDPDDLAALGRELLAEPARQRDLVIEVADRVLLDGQRDAAAELFEALDQTPMARGGDLTMRLALVSFLARDHEATRELLDRAEAYSDSAPRLARLLMAVEEHDWTELPRLVKELRATSFAPTPLANAILEIYAEELDRGRKLIAEGMLEDPRSAEWALAGAAAQVLAGQPFPAQPYFGTSWMEHTEAALRGNPRDDLVRDPREVLGVLLAFETPGWALWVGYQISQLDPLRADSLWLPYLTARGALALGRDELARPAAELLVAGHETFGPGWDLLLELAVRAADGDRFHPDVTALRDRRRDAMKSRTFEEPEVQAIDQALALDAEGETEAAAAALRKALEDLGEPSLRGTITLARLYKKLRNVPGALSTYVQAIEMQTSPASAEVSDDPLVAELLELLELPEAAAIGAGAQRAVLDRLAAIHPRDPLPPLALARLEVGSDERNPGIALDRTLDRLAQFRESVGDVALHELRPGSARKWIEFVMRYHPGRARELVDQELRLSPGVFDLWLLLGQSAERWGDREAALELYDDLVAMSSDPEAHLALADLLTRFGGTVGEVQEHLKHAQLADQPAKGRITFLHAKSQLFSSEPDLATVKRLLELLWKERAALGRELDMYELGRTLVTTWIRGGAGAMDLKKAESMATLLEGFAHSDLEKDLAVAYRGLATTLLERMPSREERLEAKDRAEEEEGAQEEGGEPGQEASRKERREARRKEREAKEAGRADADAGAAEPSQEPAGVEGDDDQD